VRWIFSRPRMSLDTSLAGMMRITSHVRHSVPPLLVGGVGERLSQRPCGRTELRALPDGCPYGDYVVQRDVLRSLRAASLQRRYR
jgi:hypothetical protein